MPRTSGRQRCLRPVRDRTGRGTRACRKGSRRNAAPRPERSVGDRPDLKQASGGAVTDFFKWIKRHLRIGSFLGTSANAVKPRIWTAVSACVLVTIIRKRFSSELGLHTILQILDVTCLEKTPLPQLLSKRHFDPIPQDFPTLRLIFREAAERRSNPHVLAGFRGCGTAQPRFPTATNDVNPARFGSDHRKLIRSRRFSSQGTATSVSS